MIDYKNFDLFEHTETINSLLARYGVKFSIYKKRQFKEQLFPFDAIPRIIEAEEFAYLERGLSQRVKALSLFIKDIYSDKKIVKDGVVPEDFIFASSGYMVECEGVMPSKGVYSHISGIDLVKGKNGEWYVLEDNRDYAKLLCQTMDYVNVEGHTVILTPGRYNAAYFEHSYLAEKTGAHLVSGQDLVVEGDKLYYRTYDGKKERVGAVYRRISEDYLYPMNFVDESLIGVPHIFDVYRKGNVALLNAPGNGVADDKGVYYFVPKIVKYYLDEDPNSLSSNLTRAYDNAIVLREEM